MNQRISGNDLDRLADQMADRLLDSILGVEKQLYLTEPIGELSGIDGVMFSGGVGEYVYERETRDFGDLGRRLGAALRARLARLPWRLLPAGECIRATAFGASEYSVQLSGNTVYVSQPGELLPRRNLQVLRPPVRLAERIDPQALAEAIGAHFKAFDLIEGDSEMALAFRWRGEPSFERLAGFAKALTLVLPNTIRQRKPIYVILDGDVGQTLGAILKEDWKLGCELLVIDGIELRDFDYIDLGRIRMPSRTVPVTIKSLVFSHEGRQA